VIPVGVMGARGRMGRLVSGAVADDPELELVAAVARFSAEIPGLPVRVSTDRHALVDAGARVVVDFTNPGVVMDNVRWAIEQGLDVVVGTTGIGPDDLEEIRSLVDARGGGHGVVVVPNFAIGAVLMQRFAAEASRFLPAVEIIELHHDRKMDAPSGTALATARAVVESRNQPYRGPEEESVKGSRGGDVEGVRIHSVRLPGLVAHQEVILGGPGQTLSIRHDSLDRSGFMPGVLMAIKEVVKRPGLTVGLEPLLGLEG